MTNINNRTALAVFIVLVSTCFGTARADWLDVANWLKLNRTPGAQRTPGEPQAGDIFIATLDGKAPQAVTVSGAFRSPVFLPDGKTLLALRGDDVVSMSVSGELPKALYAVANVVKLLGVNREQDSKLLLLLKKADGDVELGELELGSGQVTRLPNDSSNPTHRRMLNQLRGDDREYEGISIHLRTESKARMGGQTEWTDIYIKQGSQPPSNLSLCDGANCSQPSLSLDGLRVVFIKANNE